MDMKLCMGCMNKIEDHLSTCPYCGFNEITLRQESYYLDPGTIIGGKYIVGRVLNYGGHTVSYLGMDAENNRKVIVKEYLPSDFSTRSEGEKDVTIYSGDGQEQFEQGLTNFLNEANRIQQLGNVEGIASVYDCVAENETGYVISEYVEGQTLKEILDSGKKYSAEEAADFIRKILQGLSGVHRMDIVHCDISPETIMVTKTGDIKLMDFGATRYVTTANSKSLSIILKRGYAPEEQYRSKGVRGPWTDVYAVGAVMYRMITGVVPQESVERALADDLKEPSKMGVSISRNMENALMHALNVYQNERTPSAEEFLKELNSDSVKRIKVKQKKNKTGKFPLWAKGLVAGLACVVAVGGVIVVRKMSGNNPDALGSKTIVMQDLRNKSEGEVVEYIDELNQKNGWDIHLNAEDFVFDLTQESGTVYSQSVASGTVLYDPDKEQQNTGVEGLKYDSEGKITGTISVTLYSGEKLHYSEISGLNAYALAQKLEIDTADKTYFIEEEGEKGNNYFDLVSVDVAGEMISSEELDNEENQDKEINYSKNIKIHYYATEFFYWKKLPDFVNKFGSINDVPEQTVYKYTDEKKKVKVGSKPLADSNLIDDSYYAIKTDEYYVGKIVNQTVAAGEEYEEAKPGNNPLKIGVIGKVFDYHGKTGQQFVNEITEADFGNTGFGNFGFVGNRGYSNDQTTWWANREVINVKVYNDKEGHEYTADEELSYFQKDGKENKHLWIEITVREPEPETKKSQSGGSTGGGGTGGGVTGGGGSGGGVTGGGGSGGDGSHIGN